MALQGFITIPESMTVGGAPIDAFQMNAFRQNDLLLEGLIQAGFASPFGPANLDIHRTDPPAHELVFARTITVNTPVSLVQNTPLIWLASERISLNNRLDGKGRGAPLGQPGDFGGSGGGGGGALGGQPCRMPVTGQEILTAAVGGAVGAALPAAWASRVMSVMALCRGGSSGGGALGGAGGGVVILCAPLIELNAGGIIDVSGGDGGTAPAVVGNPRTGVGGGGGGGLIVLIAHRIVGAVEAAGAGQNLIRSGGVPGATGHAGGAGLYLPKNYQ